MSDLLPQLLALPLDEKIRLVQALQDSIDAEQPVPAWQLEELRRRAASFKEAVMHGRPWQEVYTELQARYGGGDAP